LTKFDWEKQTRKELPKEYLEDMEKHSKRRASQKRYKARTKSEEIKRKKEQRDSQRSFKSGKRQEQERIIQLLEAELSFDDDDTSVLRDSIIRSLIKQIKGEQQ